MSRSPTIAPSYASALSHIAYRRTCVVFGAILGLQSIWLLLAQFTRPGIDHLPTTVESAAVAAIHRNDANWAAAIGVVRGDLWSESAYTYADLLWADPSTNAATTVTLDQAHARLEKAIDYAPHQSSVCVWRPIWRHSMTSNCRSSFVGICACCWPASENLSSRKPTTLHPPLESTSSRGPSARSIPPASNCSVPVRRNHN